MRSAYRKFIQKAYGIGYDHSLKGKPMLNPKDYTGQNDGPGKFEGEPRSTNYYWDLILNGDGEDIHHCETCYTFFTVDGDESEVFDLECGNTVVIWEDDAGFVNLCEFTTREYAMTFMRKHAE